MSRLSIVLHTHMPYVEGFGTWPFGEEWLWEAVATVYLPLLDTVDGHALTLTLTPVLCDQLETMTGAPGKRFKGFLDDIRAAIHEEDSDGLDRSGEPELGAEIRRAAGDYARAREAFGDGNLLGRFAALERCELWGSAATHAVLPLLATSHGRALQVGAGVKSHERRFPGRRGGFWLPECAYEPGLERDLAKYGVESFCVYQPGGGGSAVRTEAGPVAVPLDWEIVELVWHGESGYPGSSEYRDYHARTIHDLRPWNNGGGAYRHEEALELAGAHAHHFLEQVAAKESCCCAIDTELLGHWWYEGLHWLDRVIALAPEHGVELVTVSELVEAADPAGGALAPATWGTPKDLSTWGGAQVADLAFGARRAELRTVAAAQEHGPGATLERAARELLALQSSDWAFLMTRALAGEYPLARTAAHEAALDGALAALRDSSPVPERTVRNLAPELDITPLCAP